MFNLEILEEIIIEKYNYDVFKATNGQEAIDVILN